MLISSIINDGFDLISRQLRFYCWHYKRDLNQRQQQELIDILNEHYFERLANKIKSLIESNVTDARQQIAKLLFEQCLISERRNQLKQLIESDLVDIDVRLDNYGRTLLHRTSYNLDVEMVSTLIKQGVNVRLRDYAGNTALHIAIQSYRNGTAVYHGDTSVLDSLSQVIKLLLDADKRLRADLLNNRNSLPNVNFPECYLSNSPMGDESDASNQSHRDSDQSSLESFNDNDSIDSRDLTICKMLGSHCACNPKIFNVSHLDVQVNSITDPKLTEAAMQDGTATAGCCALIEDAAVPLVDIKNAFGRTALHYCVLVVGEQHLDKIVELLLSYDADPDLVDTRLKSPLYCLIKRPGVAAVREKCSAIRHLLKKGCDDLGLALDPDTYFTEDLIKSLESDISNVLQKPTDESVDQIFFQKTFKRVPTLMHIARLKLIKANDNLNGRLCRQMGFKLPDHVPKFLSTYVNRKILDQSELF